MRASLLCFALALMAGCNQILCADEFRPAPGGATSSGADVASEAGMASGAGGAGGVVSCSSPAKCPGQDHDCIKRTCIAGVCDMMPEGPGAYCMEDGGIRCDGKGHCVLCQMDGQMHDSETDVDCGGKDCPKCKDEEKCELDSDCESAVCKMKLCQPPQCNDKVRNGKETDVDCGGGLKGCPKKCEQGLLCENDQECTTNHCTDGVCCGVDCTGLCEHCMRPDGVAPDGGAPAGACEPIAEGADPEDECSGPTNTCDGHGSCEHCDNVTQDDAETDVDCGGGTCKKCKPSGKCELGTDCETGMCNGGVCASTNCANGVKDNGESDVDCGGPCKAICGDGEACMAKSDCASGDCIGGHCVGP